VEEFLRFVIGQLVEYPDEVVLTRSGSDSEVTFHVAMRKTDIPRVIGKSGHTIQAIRLLLSSAAQKHGVHAQLEIIE